jgi:hypothetical protein
VRCFAHTAYFSNGTHHVHRRPLPDITPKFPL